jgi:hypothetical protein
MSSSAGSVMTKARARGIVTGAIILTLFGALWCIVALAFWAARPRWGIPAACVTTLALLFLCVLRLAASVKMPESRDPAAAAKGKRMGMLFGITFGIEAGLIALSSMLLGHYGLGYWIPVEVGIIVGAHFVPLAHIFEAPLYYWTAALCVLGILGCLLIHDVGTRLLCVGLVMAGALWLTAVALVVQAGAVRSVRYQSGV